MDSSSLDESTASDSTSISPLTPLFFHSYPPPSPSLTAAGIPHEAESKKLPPSRFKGVVPQPNGRWGAQIYENHQRLWLGTYNKELDVANAYDVAALRFRGRDAITNFKPDTAINFLNSLSKFEVVDILRKRTYIDELMRGLDLDREVLFEKTVTPSDVGKLNRLVIPKLHAEKNFPLGGAKGMVLNFEDLGGKVWRFRYSYWNSSQSYVLTKGWSRFVKERSLRAGDVVRFLRSIGPDKRLYIEGKPVHVVKLFGVNILEKREREELYDFHDGIKKQRIIKAL